jgi:hypothetical protein
VIFIKIKVSKEPANKSMNLIYHCIANNFIHIYIWYVIISYNSKKFYSSALKLFLSVQSYATGFSSNQREAKAVELALRSFRRQIN